MLHFSGHFMKVWVLHESTQLHWYAILAISLRRTERISPTKVREEEL